MVARVVLAVGAAVLLFSMFLNWFPGGIEGSYLNRSVGAPAYAGALSVFGGDNAWQAFSVIDVLLAALAAAGAVAAVIGRPVVLAFVAASAALLGAVVVYEAFDPPDRFLGWVGPGMVVGFGALCVVAGVAAWAAWQAAEDAQPS